MVGALPARDSALPSRGRGLQPPGALSAASAGCRNVMKATHSGSESPVRGDVGSPHRSHGCEGVRAGQRISGRVHVVVYEDRRLHRLPGPHHRKPWEVSSRRVMQQWVCSAGTSRPTPWQKSSRIWAELPRPMRWRRGRRRNRSPRQPRFNNRISPRKDLGSAPLL